MIRLFQHICKEARDRKFESSINIIQPYREEPMEDIFKLQNVQKIALWLGIMGTFVGLLLAIQEDKIGGLTRENKFAEIIQNMFDDLFISFSASLAGLEVAVIVGFLMLLLRKKHEVYFKLMESTAVTMLSVAHNATNHDDFMTEFQQVSGAVKNLSERVFDQTIELSSNLNNVQQQILSQNKQIEEGLLGLTKSGQEFGGFLTKISTDQQAFINDVRGVYDAVSLKNLGTTLQESIVQAGQHIAATINPNMSLITSQLAEFNKSIEVLRQAMSKQTADMEANVKRLERQIKEHADASKSISQQLKDSVSKAEAASPNVLRSDMNDLLREVKRLSVAVRDSYAAPRWTDWLRDKFYSFSRWRDS
jgi:predicted  nucleic acid-binding Zn-ribbon protein